MTPFPLKIVTPDGLIFDGEAEQLTVRTTGGEVGILARHVDYVAALGMGQAVVVTNGQRRSAACIGGMIHVKDGGVTLVPTTFEWADEIDPDRVSRSMERAQKIIAHSDASGAEVALAEARMKRALIRKNVYSSR